jgi:cysteine-rich repeat protein
MDTGGAAGSGGAEAGANGGATGGGAGTGPDAEVPPTEGACAACYRALCKPSAITGCDCAANLCEEHCSDYYQGICDASAGGSGGSGNLGGEGGSGGSATPSPEKDCTDGADDNNDSKIDCDDASCAEACKSMCLAPPTLESGQERGGSLQGHTTIFQATCVAVGDLGASLAYQFKAPAAGWLTLELASEGDLALSAHKGSCKAPDYSYCKNVIGAGGTETLVVEVAKEETWFAVVTAAKKNQPKGFVIRATFEAQVCGDGKVSPGEQCDDGNTVDNDGCSADCKNDSCENAPALEDKLVTSKGQTPAPAVASGQLTAGTSLLQASCSKLGVTTPERIHAFRAANPGRLEVSVVPKTPGEDLILSVRSSCAPQGELSCADAVQAGGTERLSLPAEAGQPFYFVVEGADPSAQGDYELRAQTLPVSCGDGLLVRSVEQCDPNAEEKNCADGCTRLPQDGDSSGSTAVA